ncbi:MAG: hypothetical protein QMC67_12735 [Candidatus Wallbacteria bacterium]
MHLLSNPAEWETLSEFVDASGKITDAHGESVIKFEENKIINESWVDFGGNCLKNHYLIEKLSERSYKYASSNPALGIQQGVFNIDRNIIFSKFFIIGSELNGFEIITRTGDKCLVNGALYKGSDLINTWNAVMKKK